MAYYLGFKSRIRKILFWLEGRVEYAGAQYIQFGIFGVINYPLIYFMWNYIVPEAYNPFGFRLVAGILCVPLIFCQYWPKKYRLLLPLYWYLTLLYCLPFFHVYMLLMNHASYGSLLNTLLGLFWFILLVDWIMFLIMFIIGGYLGYFFYSITSGSLYPMEPNGLPLAIFMYGYAILISLVFSKYKDKLSYEKIQSMKTLGGSIAHELRTPLRSINAGVSGIKKYVPSLLQSYQLAKEANLPVPRINPIHYESLIDVCQDVESETRSAFTAIDVLLTNVNQPLLKYEEMKICSIEECVREAISRYPFDKGEIKLVKADHLSEFTFMGDKIAIIHVLFNLFKNALYSIRASAKKNTSIQIWVTGEKKLNLLHFKDSGTGISTKDLPYIFDRFYSKTLHGTGIGLSFCQHVMESLGGKIMCQSVLGEFTEFILKFPRIQGDEKV